MSKNRYTTVSRFRQQRKQIKPIWQYTGFTRRTTTAGRSRSSGTLLSRWHHIPTPLIRQTTQRDYHHRYRPNLPDPARPDSQRRIRMLLATPKHPTTFTQTIINFVPLPIRHKKDSHTNPPNGTTGSVQIAGDTFLAFFFY